MLLTIVTEVLHMLLTVVTEVHQMLLTDVTDLRSLSSSTTDNSFYKSIPSILQA